MKLARLLQCCARRTIGLFAIREHEMEWVDSVLHYWFEELEPKNWFTRDESVDATVRARFESLYRTVSQSDHRSLATPREHLAAVIVLDQFPRNMYRGSPQAFAADAIALSIAARAIGAGLDAQLQGVQRKFLYMPYQHSEDLAVQTRSLELFTDLGEAEALDYAQQHRDVIARFGRFPHRNAVLGRDSTPEELEFLATHRGF